MHPTDPELESFLEETLDADTNALIDSHVAECSECQSRVERLIDSTFGVPKVSTSLPRSSTVNPGDTQTPDGQASKAIDQANIDLRFVIVDELASGGMGTVYRGFDRDFKREVAIKIAHQTTGETSAIRFYREAQISGQLQHPGIVPVHQTGRLTDGRQYIAMKLVKGRTLSSVIHETKESQPARLFSVFGDVCNTMAYAHSRDIIHRDLKPENIMVGAFGEVQIMDWGLARQLARVVDEATSPNFLSGRALAPGTARLPTSNATGSAGAERTDIESTGGAAGTLDAAQMPGASAHPLTGKDLPGSTKEGDVFGTPAYMSPEQARGDKSDKRTDVFALGGILFEILTGKPPFDGPTASVALQQSVESDLANAFERLDRSGADEELVTLTKSCLAADPNNRPADAQAVSLRFGDYLAGREQRFEETRLEKARATERLIAQQKRNKQLLVSGGIILATVIASACAGYMYLSEKSTRLANEAIVEREALELKVRHESEIRNSINGASEHAAAADNRKPHERHIDWSLALKEIEKAVPLVSDTIDPELRTEFLALESGVRAETTSALRRKADHEAEKQCVEDLFPLREHSFYPEDMRLCKLVYLAPQFETIFKRLGIEPGTISRDAIARIVNSEFKTQLIHGLMVWQHEASLYLVYNDVHINNAPELKRTHEWLRKFIELVDPDPVRTKLRATGLGLENEKLALLQTDEAVSSLLTVYAAASALNFSAMDDKDRIAYFLRAHQKHPKDFFVNWWLPVMSGQSGSQETYALACYSLRPNNPAVLTAVGTALINAGKPAQAIEPLERLTKVAPWYYLGHENLALAYGKTGQFKKAKAEEALTVETLEAARDRFETRLEQYRKAGQQENIRSIEQVLARFEPNPPPSPKIATGPPPELSAETIAAQEKLEQKITAKKQDIIGEPDYKARYGRLRILYSELCELLADAKRPDLVEGVVDQAIEDFWEVGKLTEVAAPHENLSEFCEERGRLDVAIEALRTASNRVPDYRRHKDHLIKLHTKFCQLPNTISRPAELQKAVNAAVQDMRRFSDDETPDSDYFHKLYAQFAETHRRFGDAIVGYQRSSVAEPNYSHWQVKLSEMYLAAGQTHKLAGRSEQANALFDSAIKLNREWVAREPDNKTPHERLSEACGYRGHYSEAMKHLTIAIGIVPHYAPHHDRYAKLAVSLSQQQEPTDQAACIETLTTAINWLTDFGADDVRLVEPRNNLSRLQARAGQFDEAIKSLKFVIRKSPGNQLLQERLGHLHVQARQPNEAEAIFKSLIEASPNSQQVVTNLARFYLDQNRLSDAKSLIRAAQERGVTSQALTSLLHESQDR